MAHTWKTCISVRISADLLPKIEAYRAKLPSSWYQRNTRSHAVAHLLATHPAIVATKTAKAPAKVKAKQKAKKKAKQKGAAGRALRR